MYARILIPLDGSAAGERGLHEGLALAQALKATALPLDVVDLPVRPSTRGA